MQNICSYVSKRSESIICHFKIFYTMQLPNNQIRFFSYEVFTREFSTVVQAQNPAEAAREFQKVSSNEIIAMIRCDFSKHFFSWSKNWLKAKPNKS